VGVVAGLAFALAWLGPSAEAQTSADWPGFQGGPEHQGVAQGPSAPLTAAWTLKAGEMNARLSGAVVAAGVGVTVSRNEVLGFDPGSGARLWSLARAAGALTPAALDPSAGDHGMAVVTEGTTESNSAVIGVDLGTHTRVWTVHLRKPVLGAPTLSVGTAYVGGSDGFVYALDVATGAIRWKTHSMGAVDASPAVGGNLVLASAEDLAGGQSRLYALDATSGRIVWTYSPAAPATGGSAVTVADGRVYAGFADHTVRSLDLRTGRVVWDEAVRDAFSPFTAPALAGGVVYAADQSGGLYAFDAATGARRWDFAFRASVLVGAPVVVGAQVFLGLSDGSLAALDTTTGDLVWETVYASGAVGALASTGAALLAPVVGSDGGLVGLEPDPSGHLIERESPSRLHLPLAMANFAVAFVIAVAAILGAFRLLTSRSGPTPAPAPVPDGEPAAETDQEPDEAPS
jgi:outer membrane protein assembly factor BamB